MKAKEEVLQKKMEEKRKLQAEKMKSEFDPMGAAPPTPTEGQDEEVSVEEDQEGMNPPPPSPTSGNADFEPKSEL